MNTECFIKSFLLIAVIFLIIKCWSNNEPFANIDFTSAILAEKIKKFKPVELELNNTYVFVSFNQLKEDQKKIVIDKLKNDTNFMDSRELKQDVEKGIFYKTPIFIVPKNEALSNKLDFILISEGGTFALSPRINNTTQDEEFVYFNKNLGLLYSARTGPNNDTVHINDDGFVNLLGLNNNWNGTNLMTIQHIDNKDLKLKVSIK